MRKKTISIFKIAVLILFVASISSCKKDKNITTTIPKIDSTLVTLYNTVSVGNQFGDPFIDLDEGKLYALTSALYPDAIDHQDKIDAVYHTYGEGSFPGHLLINPFEICDRRAGNTSKVICDNLYNGVSKWTTKNKTEFSLTTITYSQLLQIKYNFQLDSLYKKSIQDSPSYDSYIANRFGGDVCRFKTNLGKGFFVVSQATGSETTLGELIISILYLKD